MSGITEPFVWSQKRSNVRLVNLLPENLFTKFVVVNRNSLVDARPDTDTFTTFHTYDIKPKVDWVVVKRKGFTTMFNLYRTLVCVRKDETCVLKEDDDLRRNECSKSNPVVLESSLEHLPC